MLEKNTFSFLDDLSKNNDRAWFEENKERYEKYWLLPAQAFVNAWAEKLSSLHPPHKAEARINGSIRRIHRDTRFSKDKRPYDPRLHLVFWCGGHPQRSPAIHLVIYPDRVVFGAGQWSMTPAEKENYYNAVLATPSGPALEDIVKELGKSGYRLQDETLKRIPRGYPADSPRAQFLKRKGLVLTTSGTPFGAEVLEDNAWLYGQYQTLSKLNGWIMQATDPG